MDVRSVGMSGLVAEFARRSVPGYAAAGAAARGRGRATRGNVPAADTASAILLASLSECRDGTDQENSESSDKPFHLNLRQETDGSARVRCLTAPSL
jgi:hypothetical protein